MLARTRRTRPDVETGQNRQSAAPPSLPWPARPGSELGGEARYKANEVLRLLAAPRRVRRARIHCATMPLGEMARWTISAPTAELSSAYPASRQSLACFTGKRLFATVAACASSLQGGWAASVVLASRSPGSPASTSYRPTCPASSSPSYPSQDALRLFDRDIELGSSRRASPRRSSSSFCLEVASSEPTPIDEPHGRCFETLEASARGDAIAGISSPSFLQ